MPMHLEPDRAKPALPATPPGLRVLVVEDNIDAQFLVCEMLKAFGHAVTAASNAEDALAALAGAPFDVLFTDVSLPGMSGLDLARRARQQHASLGVIFASGYGDSLSARIDFPAISLKKPYELDELQAALAQAASGNGVR